MEGIRERMLKERGLAASWNEKWEILTEVVDMQ
jgi:hypothetical protein